MHCNLKPPDAASVVLYFNWDACAKFEVGQQPVRLTLLLSYSVFTADTLCYAVTLTFDLWPWTPFVLWCMGRDVVKLCTKSEQNRTISGGVMAISIFDLMTLNMCHVMHCALEKFSHSLNLVNPSIH